MEIPVTFAVEPNVVHCYSEADLITRSLDAEPAIAG